MKRNTILNVSVAVAVFFTAAIGAMSFKKSGDKAVKADTIYTYNSNDISEGAFANTANWVVVSTAPGCGSSGKRPCNITLSPGETLSSQISGLTNSQVLAIHPTERKP